MIGNSYYDLAMNDRKWLLRSLQWEDDDLYNRQVVDCQQVVEKILKGLVETTALPAKDIAELLKTHNLRKLGLVVNKEFGKQLNVSDLAYLKDYYFEARCPGDNFICVSKEERDKCLEIMDSVINELCDLIPKDYYFEARYPGDNFICVSKEECDKFLEIMDNAINELCDLIPKGFSTKQMNCF